MALGVRRKQDARSPVLYLAPWVDLGGSDKGTIDWFRHVDRNRWAPSIVTTQPSPNRWLPAIEPYAEEVWALPDLIKGCEFPAFILGFIESRGVELIHIMNSRLAFDLMPDITCLPNPPAVVVQLHAEEPDRSGYVRYVASRYGNLVDAFSVTSHQLADAMLDYDVPRSRLHVITTGVDGRAEFDPARVMPFELDGEGAQILWPGRLVAQKDPMLTLDVVRLLVLRGLSFTLQIVGDGEMEAEVRQRARDLQIDHVIRWHPPSHDMPRWYRSCDLLLMTSVFEGVPYVMYEAQAMGLPVVAPALPGNVEFMDGQGGTLIDPRDDAEAYADALQFLIEDEEKRRSIGAQARGRMLRDFTVEQMGREHDQLYERVLTTRPVTARRRMLPPEREVIENALQEPVRFSRQSIPERSVAVIIPCYQHGRFLRGAVESARAQTLLPRRIVVVDDGSADAETTEALDELACEGDVTVLRLAENVGPSAARNRALQEITESYVLPLDADDRLLPRALEEMVERLEMADEDIGFVYPNPLHFGNRHDYFEAPAYNLHLLLNGNYCAATSLFDRRAFDAGIRYREDVITGHEDWELVLQLAERGIHGVPAEGPTFLYRKQGFSRVNAVEYGPELLDKRIEQRHPNLFGARDAIKGHWAPALSLVLVDGFDGDAGGWPDDLLEALDGQTCRDFEVIRAAPLPDGDQRLAVTDVGGEGLARVAAAVSAARGRWVVLAGAGAAPAVRRRTFVEQMIRTFWSNESLRWLVVADVPGSRVVPLAALEAEQVACARPRALAWRREPDEAGYAVETGLTQTPLEDILLAWELEGPVQWRST